MKHNVSRNQKLNLATESVSNCLTCDNNSIATLALDNVLQSLHTVGIVSLRFDSLEVYVPLAAYRDIYGTDYYGLMITREAQAFFGKCDLVPTLRIEASDIIAAQAIVRAVAKEAQLIAKEEYDED